MSNKKTRHSRLRILFVSAFTTFCILFMCAGFMIADYNSRKMGFGYGSLRIDVYAAEEQVKANILGRKQTLDITESTEKWAGRIWNLLPPGVRAVFWFLKENVMGFLR